MYVQMYDHNKQFHVERSKLCQVQLFCMHVFMRTFVYIHIPAIEDIIVDKNVMEVHVTVCTCMNADINMCIYANTHAHMNVYLCTFMYGPAIEDVIADTNVMDAHVTICTCMNIDINMYTCVNVFAHINMYVYTSISI